MPDVSIQTLSDHIAKELRIAELPDYPGAMNGLQLARAIPPPRAS
jgi:hypothetical protein